MPESRQYIAEYYDAFEFSLDDVYFYEKFTSPNSTILELGAGTGRATIPLAKKSKSIVGVDISDKMLEQAKSKCTEKNIQFMTHDMTTISLKRKFDLVIAPFRVLQCLEKSEQVSDFFKVIRQHLKPTGTAILNVFNPKYPSDEMKEKWITNDETFNGEKTLSNGDLLKFTDTRTDLDIKNQVLHPILVYRRYNSKGELTDHHTNPICMRYYYPQEFKEVIESEGFEITGSWGGYNNEVYGDGPELVLSFKHI